MVPNINHVCTSVSDYYCAPEQTKVSPHGVPLFRRSSQQIDYLDDGRKLSDGKLTKKTPTPQLWEQLLVRTFVHKMEDEIPSPVDQYKCIQKEFAKLSEHHRTQSTSTYSLVSQDRLASSCPKCSPEKKKFLILGHSTRPRAHSASCTSAGNRPARK